MKSILRTAVAGVAIASFGISLRPLRRPPTRPLPRPRSSRRWTSRSTPRDNSLDFGSIAESGAGGTVDADSGRHARTCGAGLVCSGTAATPKFDLDGAAGAVGRHLVHRRHHHADWSAAPTRCRLRCTRAARSRDARRHAAPAPSTSAARSPSAPTRPAGVYTGTFEVVASTTDPSRRLARRRLAGAAPHCAERPFSLPAAATVYAELTVTA